MITVSTTLGKFDNGLKKDTLFANGIGEANSWSHIWR